MTDFGFNQVELPWGAAYSASLDEANLRKILQGIKALGASRVRMSAQLGSLDDLDRAVKLSVQYGLKPLLCIIGNPGLPGGYDGSPTSFGNQCKMLAQRYGPAGTDPALKNTVAEYEIYNEANLSVNNPKVADAAGFVPFLKAGHDGIKSVHSGATILAGGTIPGPTVPFGFIVIPFPPFFIFGSESDPIKWYTDLIAAGGGPYFDAAGMHLYFDNAPTVTTAAVQWTYLPGVRAVLDANGYASRQIWITEFGVPYPNADVKDLPTARDRLKAMVDLIKANTATLNLGPWFIYNYRCYTGGDGAGGTFGMVNADYSPRSPLFEYAQTIAGPSVTLPAAPTGVSAHDVTDSAATVTWVRAVDDVGSSVYRIYNADTGVKLAEAFNAMSKLVTGLVFGTPYKIYVTQVNTNGVESLPSASFSFNTAAPSGLQSAYQYTFTGSTLPTTFTQLGLGFAVTSGVANHNTSSTDGSFATVAPNNLNMASPDHSSRVTLHAASTASDRGAMALARMKPDGSEWVAAMAAGGTADSLRILTCIGGVVRMRNAVSKTPAGAGQDLKIIAKGSLYTAQILGAADVVLAQVVWPDTTGIFTGASNMGTGFGWQHKRVKGVNYTAPGVEAWRAADLGPVAPSPGVSDAWQLAVTDPSDWPLLISTGLWPIAL